MLPLPPPPLYRTQLTYFTQPEPLFTKIEESTAKVLREKFAGKQGGVAKKQGATTTPTNTADLQKQLDDQVTCHMTIIV